MRGAPVHFRTCAETENIVTNPVAAYGCDSETEHLACAWGKEHHGDSNFDDSPKWDLVWIIIARSISASLDAERKHI